MKALRSRANGDAFAASSAARHLRVLRRAWAHRRDLAGPARLAAEAAFLPGVLSLQETPVHPAPRRIAWALILLVACALAWLVFGRLEIVATATGRLAYDGQAKRVQPLERSVVRRVRAHEGEQVVAGQALVELDPTAARADGDSAREQIDAARSEARRAAALRDALEQDRPEPRLDALPAGRDARDQLLAEWRELLARLSRQRAEQERRGAEARTASEAVARLAAVLPLVQQREHDMRDLATQGFLAAHAAQDRLRERVELERDLATQRARMAEALAAERESAAALAAMHAEILRTLHDRQAQAEHRASVLEAELAKATRREQLATLSSPIDGTVQQLAVHTDGGVVTEAQTLMVIVPAQGRLLAEVLLDNKDIGFVHPGQRALLKLETYPFPRYGTVNAHVLRIARDAIVDERRGAVFPVTLALDAPAIEHEGRALPLAAGMNGTAEIQIGRRRLIDYLLSPLRQRVSDSMREP